MNLSLKNIQKYRNTIVLIGALTVAVIGIIWTEYLIRIANQKSPLVVEGESVKNQPLNTNNAITWTSIEVGQTANEITEKISLQPQYDREEGDYRVIRYYFNPRNPLKFHEFKFLNNRAVYIKRALDPLYEIFKIEQLTNKYGQPEILQQGYSIEVRSLYKYNIEKGNILVADVYEAQKEIFELYTMTPEEYTKFKSAVESQEEEPHNLEPEAIVD